MTQIDHRIHQFLKLIRDSWETLELFIQEDQTGSLKDDWLQANWELLVEERVVLEVYGDGADANSPSSRILFPQRVPTHRVICKPCKAGNERASVWDSLNERFVDLKEQTAIFDRFVSLGEDGWYYEKNPFSHVLVRVGKTEAVFDIHQICFYMGKI